VMDVFQCSEEVCNLCEGYLTVGLHVNETTCEQVLFLYVWTCGFMLKGLSGLCENRIYVTRISG